MKITIEEIIKKFDKDYLPHLGDNMIAIINTPKISGELASVLTLYESKRLAIKRHKTKEPIFLHFEQEFEIDFTGSIEIEFNDQPMSITLMVPLIFPKSN